MWLFFKYCSAETLIQLSVLVTSTSAISEWFENGEVCLVARVTQICIHTVVKLKLECYFRTHLSQNRGLLRDPAFGKVPSSKHFS